MKKTNKTDVAGVPPAGSRSGTLEAPPAEEPRREQSGPSSGQAKPAGKPQSPEKPAGPVKAERPKLPEMPEYRPARRGRAGAVVRVILGLLFVCAAAFAGVLIWTNVTNQHFVETFYQIGSSSVNGNLRIIQLSDLHNSTFGEENSELVDRITKLKPDIIIMSGDMLESKDDSTKVAFDICRDLVDVAPVCFIYGNNEIAKLVNPEISRREYEEMFIGEDGKEKAPVKTDDFAVMLEALGVHVLWNESVSVEVGEQTVDVYGVFTSGPTVFWNYATESFDQFRNSGNGHFKLMVAHEPYLFETYQGAWADLVLCGHTHGGEARLPKLGGVYGKEHGWFPEVLGGETVYLSGEYLMETTPLIVSNGLTNREILRINNPPELVIIDVNRY